MEKDILIKIDLYGSLKVIGGVHYSKVKTPSSKRIDLLLVDEGASYLLFQIKDEKALFHGGFNGTELKRFQEKKPGESFKYYQRSYRKLYPIEIRKLINPDIIYYYATAESIGDPRKVY